MPLMETESAWSRALRDPALRDLPYKIETNEYGQLVMSPVYTRHSLMQSRLDRMLPEYVLKPGAPAVALAIQTSKGVKVPDVVWLLEEHWDQMTEEVEASPFAPALCIEVLSRSNSAAEMEEKRGVYFEHGAWEVWICDVQGRITFYVAGDEAPQSELAPEFPGTVSLKPGGQVAVKIRKSYDRLAKTGELCGTVHARCRQRQRHMCWRTRHEELSS